jgi:hypothetical protein
MGMIADRVNASSQGRPTFARTTIGLRALLFVLACCCAATSARGQREPVHYFQSGRMPPGVVGSAQLLRGGPLPGYYQPVQLSGPEGSRIGLAVAGNFESPQPGPVLAGMLIGQVYRVKVTQIPGNEGFEVFPTIEVINRLYPPPGLEARYPIPVQFTLQELEMALSGRMVTRVIYLEDPGTALPVQDRPDWQRYYEVRATDDPLQVADRLGRPVAIMRMGSRTPEHASGTERFLFNCPPLLRLEVPGPLPDPRSGLEESQGPVPRIGLNGRGSLPHVDSATSAAPVRAATWTTPAAATWLEDRTR